MKRIAAIVVLLSTTFHLQAQQEITLQLKHKKGDKFIQKSVVTDTTRIDENEMVNWKELFVENEVLEVTDTGTYIVKTVYKRIRMGATSASEQYLYDTADTTDVDEKKAQINDMIDQSITWEMGKHLEVIEVREATSEAMETMINQNEKRLATIYPKEPVSMGYTWRTSQENMEVVGTINEVTPTEVKANLIFKMVNNNDYINNGLLRIDRKTGQILELTSGMRVLKEKYFFSNMNGFYTAIKK